MESVKSVWQILDTSQWQERDLEPINESDSKILSKQRLKDR